MLRRLQDTKSHYEHTNTDQRHMKFLSGLGYFNLLIKINVY